MNRIYRLDGEFTGAYGSLFCKPEEAAAAAQVFANKNNERVRLYAEDGTKVLTAQPVEQSVR